jgi:hypothetical protein
MKCPLCKKPGQPFWIHIEDAATEAGRLNLIMIQLAPTTEPPTPSTRCHSTLMTEDEFFKRWNLQITDDGDIFVKDP